MVKASTSLEVIKPGERLYHLHGLPYLFINGEAFTALAAVESKMQLSVDGLPYPFIDSVTSTPVVTVEPKRRPLVDGGIIVEGFTGTERN